MQGGVVMVGNAGYSLLNAILKPSRFEAGSAEKGALDGDSGESNFVFVVRQRRGTSDGCFASRFGCFGGDRAADDRCRGFVADPRCRSDVAHDDFGLADDATVNAQGSGSRSQRIIGPVAVANFVRG